MNVTQLTFADGKATTGSSKPSAPSQDFINRLQSRLESLNEQIIKLSALAAKANDEELQEKYWSAAQEVSREARELRKYLESIQQNS